ncbi:prepilin-type N-terminal cleavage/methylation domain-containing protein [bacterium]|nr:prepilin-type N-terminal cleavage/methylation domain-containing protein [bacterium]
MKRAFTLIELLVVVAVIAILVAIAVPNYRRAVARSEIAACQGNLHALGTALLAYQSDYGAFPLADGTAGWEPSPTRTVFGHGPAGNGYWSGVPRSLLLLGYLGSEEALYCPTLARRFPERRDYLRYAYNKAALDAGGSLGGADNLDRDAGDLWVCRCLFVPPGSRGEDDSPITYPHGPDPESESDRPVMENVLFHTGRVELRNAARAGGGN